MSKLKVLDLFSGIGGFSLGLERTGGFETVAFCEIEEFPRKVLAKHWPKVPIYHDVRELTAERLAADGIGVDVICGGFPCQDISTAGKGAGIGGERSGIWKEYARLIGELRPRFAIMENVAALLSRGIDVVLGDLAEIGFDAEWHCIPASAIGAHHRRDRLWLVAHNDCQRELQQSRRVKDVWNWFSDSGQDVSDAVRVRQPKSWWAIHASHSTSNGNWQVNRAFNDSGWPIEPDVGRMAYGVPNRMDRLKALGNAVVPQIPELIGNAILKSLEAKA